MNEELKQQVLEYLNSQEVQQKLEQILDEFLSQGQKQNFYKVWQAVKDFKLNIADIYSYIMFICRNELEKAQELDKKIFEQITIEVYEPLEDLYDEINQGASNTNIESGGAEKDYGSEVQEEDNSAQKLMLRFKQFKNSSLMENILQAEDNFSQNYIKQGSVEIEGLKNEFYSAVNAGDKIKAVAVLRLMAKQGLLIKAFSSDERYTGFFSSYLERHFGDKEKENFLHNPAEPTFLTRFLKFILEKRLKFKAEESAMLGVQLSVLCKKSNQSGLTQMAYGDEERGVFKWNLN